MHISVAAAHSALRVGLVQRACRAACRAAGHLLTRQVMCGPQVEQEFPHRSQSTGIVECKPPAGSSLRLPESPGYLLQDGTGIYMD